MHFSTVDILDFYVVFHPRTYLSWWWRSLLCRHGSLRRLWIHIYEQPCDSLLLSFLEYLICNRIWIEIHSKASKLFEAAIGLMLYQCGRLWIGKCSSYMPSLKLEGLNVSYIWKSTNHLLPTHHCLMEFVQSSGYVMFKYGKMWIWRKTIVLSMCNHEVCFYVDTVKCL